MSQTTDYPRDLAGYGANPPHPKWPNKARIAINFVLNYEEGGERNVLHGDGESEAFLSEMPTAVAFPNARHMSMESIYEYGSRAGVWRMLRLFKRYNIPMTIFAVATALERYPELAKVFMDEGHEICSHAYKWITYQFMSEEEEREHYEKAMEIFERVCGERPKGWYTGRDSPNTRKIVMEDKGILYDSDSYGDDLPYWVDNDGEGHLVIPYVMDTNDMRFGLNGYNNGEEFFQYLKDSFDVLYAEGAEAPKMLSIGMHCRILGRPGRIAGLERFIKYVQGHDHVWFTRRIDIANHWYANHPYKGSK
ncbi:MAG: allantoinase PuuE [Oceanisphaera sp.]|uniref:Allantoinase PuuE n=1 Tax=Oceanisphaera pacifica TaxID=2818389 RepID=A0ABS3NCD9_9GAMM|nr:allantoinase PuuE [Oceanisphaera pacifica]MBO1518264.1 allantoinase PuuE [Oceanisphaera pacifica]